MKAQVYNIKAEKTGEITLPKSVFETKISDALIAQSIKVFLANQRNSYAKAKSRSEIRGTTKKMWAQKGTGRARHGSAKAPQFVGGGSAMGPAGDQNYTLKFSKKMKKGAINSLLSKFAADKKIIIIEKFSGLTPKTKEAIKLLTGLKGANEVLSKSLKIGIITTKPLLGLKRAFGNLPQTNLLSMGSLNAYDLSNQNFLIFSKKAIKKFTK